MYPDDFHVDIDYEPKLNDVNFLKNYQIIHFHRTLGNYEVAPQIIENARKLGIVTIIDLDDYWLPTKEHPAYNLVIEHDLHKKIMANTKAAEYVTTTTSIYADEIKKINKNVFILPNAINPDEPQFKAKTEKSDKLRFGWLGGSSHLHDINLLEGNFEKMQNLKDQFSVVLCGFDTRGTVTEINSQTKEQKQRPIKPHETVWARYEEIFTNNYKLVSDKQKEFLLQFSNEEYMGEENPYYRRVWTQPVTSYAKNYRLFDVSLAPIKNHIFNRMKSQLKVIEAGFYKKPIIASNVGPYSIDLKHALNNGNFTDGNALLVDENRNHSDWSKYMKKLIQNPSWVEDLGEKLYDTVKDKYHIKTVTQQRAELYKSLVK